MPELPSPKPKPHPWTSTASRGRRAAPSSRPVPYAELHTTTNFTFLTGASHPEELVERAAALGHRAIAITDRNTLAGIVRGHVASRETGLPLVVGCRLEIETEPLAAVRGDAATPRLSILVYPTSRAAYGRLCRLLTLGKRRVEKGECRLALHDLLEHEGGLLAVVVPPPVLDQRLLEVLRGLRDVFTDDRLSVALSRDHGPDDGERLARVAAVARAVGVPLVATNDVHYHVPERRMLQDVLTCIRHGCTLATAGYRLMPHAERFLKPADEMARLLAEHPEAIARTVAIAERATAFSLDGLRYEYPHEVCPPGRTAMTHLRDLTRRGAGERYPGGVPDAVERKIAHELGLIEELDYAAYFLTVHDLVVFARSRGILCQGRGAAANSAVCYCLDVTAVDPDRTDLLFERFISKERDEPPDIDIDFEHERREEVIQYIYGKYGRERAALTAEVITYRGRSAVREVGKALGLSLDCVDRLARNIDWWHDGVGAPEQLREIGVNPADPTIRRLRALANEILGFPRHLSQHVGGFVITETPLCELVPIENAAMPDRTVIEWDKDDIDAMGMLKVDVLGLGMLTCIRKALEMVNGRRGEPVQLHTVPAEDPDVYDMICAADTVGVFQIESRAQMSMLPRLRPRCFYDLVIEVAIVRPGPIQGDMVHPYLRRRNGEEPVTYPSPDVRKVLAKTLGVPLFQEQAMSLAIVAAGFSPGEADRLRRAMAAWKRRGNQIERFGRRLIDGMLARGYERSFAERCFEQIKGFSEYGFPESHAASFALLVYVSAWLKRHQPAAFAAALLNSQPMGFYAPAQIVRDARDHGVTVRPVDVNRSAWDCTLEDADEHHAPCLRLGMRIVKGLREPEAEAIAGAVMHGGPFRTIAGLRRASGVRIAALRALANADGFGSMGLERQRALWELRALRDEVLPMFDGREEAVPRNEREADGAAAPVPLPEVPEPRKVAHDYAATRLSLKAHPIAFLRERLDGMGVTEARRLRDESRWPQGRRITVAGLVLVRQRPSTANGIVFMTLEDETGIANLIVRPKTYARYRTIARHGIAIVARGRIERQGEVVHVQVQRFEPLDEHLRDLVTRSRDFH
jgi:error-prone DNA polymerase